MDRGPHYKLKYVDDSEYLAYLSLFFANSLDTSSPEMNILCSHMVSLTVITKLGKKLYFKERVIAAAIVLFRRKDNNLPKNSCCAADPFIVIAACCYVVGKAEESPSPAENAVAGAHLCSVVRSLSCSSM